MSKTRSASVVIFTLLVLLPSIAQAVRSRPEDRRRVFDLITHPSRVPTLEDWQRVGPTANKILIELYHEGGQKPRVRRLAVYYLAWFPSRRTRGFLRTLANDDRGDIGARREALLTMGRAFGTSALMDLRPFLDASKTKIREGAIYGIAAVGDEQAKRLLDQHRSAEPDIDLRALTERLMADLPRLPTEP